MTPSELKMAYTLLTLSLIVALTACSGGGGGGGGGNSSGGGGQNSANVQAVSALGVPAGSPIVVSIGPSSGGIMVTSPSGSFTLTIPAGAVSTATTFTIQPLTSTTNPWQDTTSEFGIEGLDSLTKPVTLSIAYSGEGGIQPSQDNLFMSLQDLKGAWWYFGNSTWDGTSLSVTLDPSALSALSSVSFSSGAVLSGAGVNGYAKLAALSIGVRAKLLGPSDVYVNKRQLYQVMLCDPSTFDPNAPYLSQLTNNICQPLQLIGSALPTWKVSGITDGNGTVGIIAGSGCGSTGCSTYYQAPAKVPANPKVSIDAVIKFISNGIKFLTIDVGKNVTIHDVGKYHVAASYSDNTYPICSAVTATVGIADAFDLDLASLVYASNYVVSNIINIPAVLGTPSYDPVWLANAQSSGSKFSPITFQGPSLDVFLNTATASAASVQNQPPQQSTVVIVQGNFSYSVPGCYVSATDSKGNKIIIEDTTGGTFSDGFAFAFYPDPNLFDNSGSQVVYANSIADLTTVHTTPPADSTVPVWKFTVTQLP
jgi:hypothetical protein